MDEIISFVDGNFCEESETGRHYAESYLYERYELDDGTWDWRYRCVCEYCFESFYASAEALAAAYSNYVSTLDSTTISSDDLTTGTASTYLYNGVELPDINAVWTDKETYPNAYIIDYSFGGFIELDLCQGLTVDNKQSIHITFPGLTYRLSLDSNEWVLFENITESKTSYWNYFPLIWASVDVPGDIAASAPVPVDGSDTTSDTKDRIGSYMEELDAWNQSHPYQSGQYSPNYYITPDSGNTLYSPAVFSESSMIFTEPVTGTQYPCTKWLYHYTEDNVLTYGGVPIEGDYLGSYILTLTDPVTINGHSCLNYWIVYMDDGVYVAPFYADAADNVYFPTYQFYAYAVVAQTECGIGNHSYTVETLSAPTCGTSGERLYTCSICGDEYVQDIPATGAHSYEYSVSQEPTCAVEGVALYTCSSCGNQYVEEIPTVGHAYEYSIYQAPTCTADGTGLYTCSVCGDQYTETLPATGHSGTLIEYVSPEYDENGNLTVAGYSVYECTICGAQYTVSDEVTAEKEGFFSWLWNQFSKLIESIFDGLASGIKYLLENIIGAITDWIIRIVNWVFDLFDGDALSSFFGWFSDDNEILNADFGVGSSTEVDVWAYS